MSDPMVLLTQQWVNSEYGSKTGYIPCTEDGKTGWGTINSLIMGLQSELNISPLVPSFGPNTFSHVQAIAPIQNGSVTNVIKIVQGALYCKGYDGSALSGTYDPRTLAGVSNLQSDTGSTSPTGTVSAKLFKALLSMDAFVVVPGGNPAIRTVQQWMNNRYLNRRDFYYTPCDGFFSRGVQQALIYALQFEMGMADGTATGNFGPATKAGLQTPEATITLGKADTTKAFVRLFQAAMTFNRRVVSFDGTFSAADSATTRGFQQFAALPSADGVGNYQTWCELLVSTGDPTRPGTAADCATNINSAARAQTLFQNGYRAIGRYIYGDTSNPNSKSLKPAEVPFIFGAGLTLFPIYQENGTVLSDFSYSEGYRQGQAAHANATGYGFATNTTIYFAVDYDATGDEIDSHITPYFQGVRDAIVSLGNKYAIGVYGSRNVCATVSRRSLAVNSFVGGLSTGFSGNLGFPLPDNWSFNQIQTLTITNAGTSIEIDKDVKSGRDNGVSTLTAPPEPNTLVFGYLEWLQGKAVTYHAAHSGSESANRLVAQYLRRNSYNDSLWQVVAGPVDGSFVDYVDSAAGSEGRIAYMSYRDPQSQTIVSLEHFAASLNAVIYQGSPSSAQTCNLGDFGGWAGDLITTLADYSKSGVGPSQAYSFAYAHIGSSDYRTALSYSLEDYIQDVDAMNIGMAILDNSTSSVSGLFESVNSSTGSYSTRFTNFFSTRFGGSTATTEIAARAAFTNDDLVYDAWAAALLLSNGGGILGAYTAQEVVDVAAAWLQVLMDRVHAE